MAKFDKKQARRVAQFQEQEFGPKQIHQTYQYLYDLLRGSPMFAQLMSQNAMTGNVLANRSSRALAAAGGKTAGGIPAMTSAAANSFTGFNAQNILSALGNTAFDAANNNVSQRLAALSGTGQSFQKSSWTDNLGAAFGNILANLPIPGVGVIAQGVGTAIDGQRRN